MDCGCNNRKDIMFHPDRRPGRAEVYILAIAVGAFVIAALPKSGLSPRAQGVIYGTILGGAISKTIDAMLENASNDDPRTVN